MGLIGRLVVLIYFKYIDRFEVCRLHKYDTRVVWIHVTLSYPLSVVLAHVHWVAVPTVLVFAAAVPPPFYEFRQPIKNWKYCPNTPPFESESVCRVS